jgi:hypothetical protein
MDKLEFENFEAPASDHDCDSEANKDDVIVSEISAIEFSSKIMAALEDKAQNHNNDCDLQVTADQLKKVYRRGAGFELKGEKGLSAMARVNMFLRMKSDGKITYQEPAMRETVEMKELVFESRARIQVNNFIDITENWLPIDADIAQAAEDIKVYGLDYNFKDVSELYLDDYEKLDIIWG